jgi:hypothetical protein
MIMNTIIARITTHQTALKPIPIGSELSQKEELPELDEHDAV